MSNFASKKQIISKYGQKTNYKLTGIYLITFRTKTSLSILKFVHLKLCFY